MKEKNKKREREGKLTLELQEKIVSYLKVGHYIEDACALAGISRATFYEWMRRGGERKGRGKKYRDFAKAVEEALAMAAHLDLLTIAEAKKNDWRAAAWKLERRFPEKWGAQQKMTISQDGELNIKIREILSDEETRKLLSELYRRISAINSPRSGDSGE